MASATLSPSSPARLTFAEYMALEKQSNTKHHFHKGKRLPVAGATYEHNTINANFAMLLNVALENTICHAVSSDMKVFVSREAAYYPDTVVICGNPRLDFDEALQNPVLIAEVLSPSTETFDRNEKFEQYKTIASLRHIVFLGQNAPFVQHYEKSGEDKWTLNGEIADLSQHLPLVIEGKTVVLPLSKIYRFVEFPQKP